MLRLQGAFWVNEGLRELVVQAAETKPPPKASPKASRQGKCLFRDLRSLRSWAFVASEELAVISIEAKQDRQHLSL